MSGVEAMTTQKQRLLGALILAIITATTISSVVLWVKLERSLDQLDEAKTLMSEGADLLNELVIRLDKCTGTKDW